MHENLTPEMFPREPGGVGRRYSQGDGYADMNFWVAFPLIGSYEEHTARMQEVWLWMCENCVSDRFQYNCDFMQKLDWYCFAEKRDAVMTALVFDGLT